MTIDSPTAGPVVSGTPHIRPFSESLPMALLRAREASMRLFRPLLAQHELTEQQWRVLRALTDANGPIDAGELAGRTFLLAPSVSRILVTLTSRKLIARRPDPADQRRTMITLTDVGRQAVRRVGPQSERGYCAIEVAFGEERLGHLLAELHDLAQLDIDVSDVLGGVQ